MATPTDPVQLPPGAELIQTAEGPILATTVLVDEDELPYFPDDEDQAEAGEG